MWAPLRSTVPHTPSPLERCGMDGNAKITAAHANTGSHTVTTRDLVVTGGDASLRPTNRRAARESGASPERSRRCEGRRSRATCHWPTGWEGGEGGSPESEDLRRRQTRTPRGWRIRVSPTHSRARGPGRAARRPACDGKASAAHHLAL